MQRRVWNLVHWGLGKACAILAIINIIIGWKLWMNAIGLDAEPWKSNATALNGLVYFLLIGWGVVWLVILIPYEYLALEPQKRQQGGQYHNQEGSYDPPSMELARSK
jgi:hypothetical protein